MKLSQYLLACDTGPYMLVSFTRENCTMSVSVINIKLRVDGTYIASLGIS